MIVIRYSYIDRINFFALFFKQFPPVAVQPCAGNKLRSFFEVIGVYIAQCNNLYIGVTFELLKVVKTHSANTNAGMIEFSIPGSCLRRLAKDHGTGNSGGCCGGNKLPAG